MVPVRSIFCQCNGHITDHCTTCRAPSAVGRCACFVLEDLVPVQVCSEFWEEETAYSHVIYCTPPACLFLSMSTAAQAHDYLLLHVYLCLYKRGHNRMHDGQLDPESWKRRVHTASSSVHCTAMTCMPGLFGHRCTSMSPIPYAVITGYKQHALHDQAKLQSLPWRCTKHTQLHTSHYHLGSCMVLVVGYLHIVFLKSNSREEREFCKKSAGTHLSMACMIW